VKIYLKIGSYRIDTDNGSRCPIEIVMKGEVKVVEGKEGVSCRIYKCRAQHCGMGYPTFSRWTGQLDGGLEPPEGFGTYFVVNKPHEHWHPANRGPGKAYSSLEEAEEAAGPDDVIEEWPDSWVYTAHYNQVTYSEYDDLFHAAWEVYHTVRGWEFFYMSDEEYEDYEGSVPAFRKTDILEVSFEE